MDKASDYESGDSRFESWRGRKEFCSEKESGICFCEILASKVIDVYLFISSFGPYTERKVKNKKGIIELF